jgi:hypothetical protein
MNEATKKQASQDDPIEDGFIAKKSIDADMGHAWPYNPIFELGTVTATPAALGVLGPVILDLLIKHADMEQGELCNEDQQANVLAVKDGERILSCFKYAGVEFYVITEWDRSLTTVLLKEEY